jgi:hypothetical protein
MIVEEVAQICRHGAISPLLIGLGVRFVEHFTSHAGGAGVTPWSSRMVATPGIRVSLVNVASRSALVRVALKLAGASVLDERERQVFGVVKVIQDDLVILVARGTKRGISRSLEGSHEDGLQNVFDGEVTNVAHGAVDLGDRSEMMVDYSLGVSIPAHHASRTVCMRLWSRGKAARRASHTFWAQNGGAEPWASKTFIESVIGAQRS